METKNNDTKYEVTFILGSEKAVVTGEYPVERRGEMKSWFKLLGKLG